MSRVPRVAPYDLNLLAVAAALYEHRNVSRAAKSLGLSQSAVSHALARMRVAFGDPMFVRSPRGVVPTDRALSLEAAIRDVIARAQTVGAPRGPFEPSTARGRCVIASSDYFEAVVGPELVPAVATRAPGVQLSLRPTLGELPKLELTSGEVDVAIAGFYAQVPEGFYQSRLFVDEYAVAVREGHPTIRRAPDAATYRAHRHAIVTLQGDFRTKVPRDLAYGSYSFTGLAWVLERTDLVLTAPAMLLRRYAERFRVRVYPCPIALGAVHMRMVWHARTHDDPLRAWLRQELRAAGARAERTP